ncbi:MAG: alpha/beta hydrolase family esterase [Polymorphobacter sp.]
MRNLADTVGRLTARRRAMEGMVHGTSARLTELTAFGSNPGDLRGWTCIPSALPAGAPLVVVLHGCTQTAVGYDIGSGWSDLAHEAGFAVLFAEQGRANNPNLCFNWFVPGDTRRGLGEAESIRQMVAELVAIHGFDRRRIFITGLSAGGAMAASLLAAWPDMFAGGAIIAGVPHGSAVTMSEAFDRMRGSGLPDAGRSATLVRAASPHAGPWPKLSVWHGSNDGTVDPANGEALAAGWAALHGLSAPPASERINGHVRRSWRNGQGEIVIEAYSVTGMGHGTPITTAGAEACGTPGPFMLEAGISSTRRIAAFWGIAPAVAAARPGDTPKPAQTAGGVADVINMALRQAGLLR